MAPISQQLLKVKLFFYFIGSRVWKRLIEEQKMKHCKEPLDVIAHKVSTITTHLYSINTI